MAATTTKTKPSLPLPRPRGPRPPRLEPGSHTGRSPTARALAVLEELEALFKTEGFAHLTAQDLAARLGCSRRMLYQLAPSLDELAALVVDRFMQRMGRRSYETASTCTTRADQLDAYTRTGVIDWASASPAFNRDMQALPTTRRLVDAHYGFWATIVEGILELGVQEGEFIELNSAFVAQLMLAGALRTVEPELLHQTGLDVATAVNEFDNIFINGIRRRNE